MSEFASMNPRVSRRRFLSHGAAAASIGAASVTLPRFASGCHQGGTDLLRIGLIGCGGRGTGATKNCVASSKGVELVAMADLFPDRLAQRRPDLEKALGDSYRVKADTCFTGFDAYRQLLALDSVDLVILATPPAFRPQMLEAAIKAGKHVFMEKPVAVCPAGIRSVIASGELAKQKGLAIVSGTQRRHQTSYIETIQRIREGAIGDIVSARCYWNQGALWVKERKPEWTDLEWQLRNWLYFTWLSGDHIVEQHIHNIDVINWIMGGPPAVARGMGGRQVRTDPKYGHINDHFSVEFEYPNGVVLDSKCRQIDGTWRKVGEAVVGTKGTARPDGRIFGTAKWRFRGKAQSAYVQEHADLIASVRSGKPLNEARRVAESTLTAIIGRMSTYTGKPVRFDWALRESKLDLMPGKLAFGDWPVAPVAMPGRTPLI